MKNLKVSTKEQEFKPKNKSIFDLFENAFYGIPSHLRGIRKTMNKNTSMIHEFILSQFNSPSVRNKGYVHLFIEDFQEEFEKDMSKSSLYRSLTEIEEITEAGILIYDLGKGKGKFYFIKNSESEALFEKINSNEIKLILDRSFRVLVVNNLIDISDKIKNNSNETQFPPVGFNSHTRENIPTSDICFPTGATAIPTHEKMEGVKKQPQLLDWSSLEADLQNITKEVNKEVYKESYHKEVSFLPTKVDTQAVKNKMMNDDLYNKIEKKEEDKISNFYLSEMIDLGIYEKNAKSFLSKLSTDDIQKAFDKLEAAKDSGYYIKNEGNFIRETLESFINPSFKPKYSIQEKEAETLPIPAPIRKDNPNELELRLNEYLEFFLPNITKVIHGFDTKTDEFNKKLINKFNAYILETYSEDQELNDNRDRFIAQIQELKKDSNNKVKDIVYLSINNPFLNKKTESGQRVLELFLEWFEEV